MFNTGNLLKLLWLSTLGLLGMLVKLGKLTVATTVYRGLSGFVLPEQFTKKNAYGVKGGVEGAFMSTTLDRKVAMSYAATGGKAGSMASVKRAVELE